MKQISSLELSHLIKELKLLINGRFDKAYQSGKEELLIQFYVPGKGKKLLKLIVGKAIFLTGLKEEYEEPSSFCMFLRKQLSNSKLKGINQKESERIIEFVFEKEGIKKLIIEIFGGGNVILCDKDDIILSALSYHKFKQRSILPKTKYSYPKSKLNIFELKLNELKDIFEKSDRENIVKCLAVELGLGGLYSEEICLLSKTDKSKKPNELGVKEAKKMLNEIRQLADKKIKPGVIYEKKEIIDAVPFDLEFYKNKDKGEFKNFSEALESYFKKFTEKKPSKYEKQLEKLREIIKKQESKIRDLEEKEAEERKKADIIYNNYNLIKEVIVEINNASKKYSWNEIKDRLKNHKLIKETDSKEKKVVMDIE